MIRICRYLYINPLTAAFFIVCYFSGKTPFFLISYCSMLLHETAHLAAAAFIGLKVSHMSLHPFGVNLRLKNTLVYSIFDEIILYLSGPLCNLILSLISITLLKKVPLYDYGFAVNIALFAANMLPIYPLDGGNIAKKVLIYHFGENTAQKIMTAVSALLSAGVLLLGIYAVKTTGYNYSVIFISVLIFANIFTSREKYSQDTVRNLVFAGMNKKRDKNLKIRLYAAEKNFNPVLFAKYLRPGKYTCAAIIDEDGSLSDIITEDEITKTILNTEKSDY
ncbi:MAG: hypothetical protein J6N52_10700 [Clostridia bacterium]|nr:hypothetical protein [Clostridia bacterium]